MSIAVPLPKDLLLGEGVFYFNYDEIGEAIIGATRGGGSFSRETDIRHVAYDGAMGHTKNLRHKSTANCALKLKALTINAENLIEYYAGLQITGADPKVITAVAAGIASTDYLTNVAFVGKTKDGRAVVVIVENALGDGNIELAFNNKDEVVPEIQFTGHYDPTTPTVEPWEIRWPANSPAVSMTLSPASLAAGYAAQNIVVAGTGTMFAPGVTTLTILDKDTDDVTGTGTVTVFSATAAVVALPAGFIVADSPYVIRLTTGTQVVNATLTITA